MAFPPQPQPSSSVWELSAVKEQQQAKLRSLWRASHEIPLQTEAGLKRGTEIASDCPDALRWNPFAPGPFTTPVSFKHLVTGSRAGHRTGFFILCVHVSVCMDICVCVCISLCDVHPCTCVRWSMSGVFLFCVPPDFSRQYLSLIWPDW